MLKFRFHFHFDDDTDQYEYLDVRQDITDEELGGWELHPGLRVKGDWGYDANGRIPNRLRW